MLRAATDAFKDYDDSLARLPDIAVGILVEGSEEGFGSDN